jgi:predicted regulator of Ras-like GTPase activity (Roadblock/LC7/MglB family)
MAIKEEFPWQPMSRDENWSVHSQEYIIVCPESGEDRSHPVIASAKDRGKPPVIRHIENCIQSLTCWGFCRSRAIIFEGVYTVRRLAEDERIRAKALRILWGGGRSLENQSTNGLARGRIMEYVLGKLLERCPEIGAGVVATYEGLLLAAAVRDNDEPENIGAISSLILDNSTRIIRELDQGTLTQLFILGTAGYTLLANVGEVGFLTVTSKNCKIHHSTYNSFLKAVKAVEMIQDWLVWSAAAR